MSDWHFIDVDLGLRDVGNGQSERATHGDWLDRVPLFAERVVWNGLLAKHSRFIDHLEETGQA